MSDEESLDGSNRLVSDDEVLRDKDVQTPDEEADNDGGAESNNGKKDDNASEVKVKRVRNPIPKLNEETLKGPKGLAAVESHFEHVKFKGKGHEDEDLNVVMKIYEYWCHRLFPKFPFDTCIERLERLGTKRAVQTHIKRIRFDLLTEDKPIIDSSDEEMDATGFVDIANSQIDRQFDQLRAAEQTAVREQEPELTEEQLEQIRLNKERAARLRQEKLLAKTNALDTNFSGVSEEFTSDLVNEVGEDNRQLEARDDTSFFLQD